MMITVIIVAAAVTTTATGAIAPRMWSSEVSV
jgi:hypothetical protein